MSDTSIPFGAPVFGPSGGWSITPIVPSTFSVGTPLDGNYNPATTGFSTDEANPTDFLTPCIGLAAQGGSPGQVVPLVTSGVMTLLASQFCALLDSTIYGQQPGYPAVSPQGGPGYQATLSSFFGQPIYVSQGNPYKSLPPPAVSGVFAMQNFVVDNPILQSQIIQVGTLVKVAANIGLPDYLVGIVVNIQNLTPQKPFALFDYAALPTGVVIGQPVYVNPSGVVEFAQANEASTANVLGLSAFTQASGGGLYGPIVTQGLCSATLAQWDEVTGASMGGLIPGAQYYLSAATAGMITTVAPSGENYIVPVGVALSSTVMFVRPGLPVEA